MSLRLKSRMQSPPNGFQFRQPQTGWFLQTWSFTQLVDALIEHRKKNPRFNLPTDVPTVEAEVDKANAMRVLSIKGGENYTAAEGGPVNTIPKMVLPRLLTPSPAGSAVAKLDSGRQVLQEWLGEGGVPVDQSTAEARALLCSDCPQNGPTSMSWFTKPVAEVVRRALEIKNDMGLETSQDAKLDGCKACECPLKLKVWTPLKHILNYTPDAVRAELDPRCWVTK